MLLFSQHSTAFRSKPIQLLLLYFSSLPSPFTTHSFLVFSTSSRLSCLPSFSLSILLTFFVTPIQTPIIFQVLLRLIRLLITSLDTDLSPVPQSWGRYEMHLTLVCLILFSFHYNYICFLSLLPSLTYKYKSLERANLVIILICILYHIYHALETHKKCFLNYWLEWKQNDNYKWISGSC